MSSQGQYEQPLEEWQEVLEGAFHEVEETPRRRVSRTDRMVALLLIGVFLAPLALPIFHNLGSCSDLVEMETSAPVHLQARLLSSTERDLAELQRVLDRVRDEGEVSASQQRALEAMVGSFHDRFTVLERMSTNETNEGQVRVLLLALSEAEMAAQALLSVPLHGRSLEHSEWMRESASKHLLTILPPAGEF